MKLFHLYVRLNINGDIDFISTYEIDNGLV